MTGIHYTYVWGGGGKIGYPLTFGSNRDRLTARRDSDVGDLVFGVVSRSPSDPSVVIPEAIRGRVVTAWQISHQDTITSDYGMRPVFGWDRKSDGSYRWPYALQPLRVWELRDPPEFRAMDGYRPETHTQRAITTLQRIEGKLAAALLAVLAERGEERTPLEPASQVLTVKIRELRQRHPFALKDYHVTPNPDAVYSIYVARLGPKGRVLKIGHALDPKARVSEFNAFRLASEPQWVLWTSQKIGTVQEAVQVEARLGEIYARHRSEPNNNEVFHDLDPALVLARLATLRVT